MNCKITLRSLSQIKQVFQKDHSAFQIKTHEHATKIPIKNRDIDMVRLCHNKNLYILGILLHHTLNYLE